MRKSTSRNRSRLIAAGVGAGAIAAALVVAPQPAFAVTFSATNPIAGPPGTIINVTSNDLWTMAAPVALFVPTTTPATSACPAAYSTASATAGTVSKVSNGSLNITVPTTLVAGVSSNVTVSKEYSVCTYASTTATSFINEGFFHVTPPTVVTPAAGPSGGGTTVSVAFPTTAVLPATIGSMFVPKATTCPAVYSTANTEINGGVARSSDTVATVNVPVGAIGVGSAPTAYNVCLYSGVTHNTSKVLATSGAAPYTVQLPPVTPSLSIGAGGNGTNTAGPTIVLSSTANFLTGITSPGSLFTTAACPATYKTTPANSNSAVLKSANNRGAVTVPIAASAVSNAATLYNVCVYSGTVADTSRLVANSTYTAAVPPSVTTVSPGAGSALGGDLITVTGTGFPTNVANLKATLGGVPLNITPVDPFTFTAITPMHAGELDVPLVVTTDTGTFTKTNAFDYMNAISISPNTASNANDGVWVDVKGAGFESLTFDTNAFALATDTEARIWLVDYPAANCTDESPLTCSDVAYAPGGSGANAWAAGAGPSAECLTPVVISSNELFCKLNLFSGHLVETTGLVEAAPADAVVPIGTYSLVVASSGTYKASTTTTEISVISSGSTFTVANF